MLSMVKAPFAESVSGAIWLHMDYAVGGESGG